MTIRQRLAQAMIFRKPGLLWAGLLCAGLLSAGPAAGQPVDPNMDRALSQTQTNFGKKMRSTADEARRLLADAALAAQVCDKEKLEYYRRQLENLLRRMEAEQSSWMPPYSNDFDPNMWGYVHNQLMHAAEQAAAWMRIDCTFPNVPRTRPGQPGTAGSQPGTTGSQPGTSGQPGAGEQVPDIADDIDAWNRTNHEEWFETVERLRLKGECGAWIEQINRVADELRRKMRNPTGDVDQLPQIVARYQRLYRYLLEEVRNRPCPPAGAVLVTPEQRLIARREEERERRARTPPPPFDQVPHRNYSPPSEESREQRLQRLDAINRLRTNDAERSGTEVTPSFGNGGDPSRQVREDVRDRTHDADASRRTHHDRGPGGTPPAGPAQSASPPSGESTPGTGPAQSPSETPAQTPASGDVSGDAPLQTRIGGRYQVGDRSAGAADVTIIESGGRLILQGLGQPIPLEQGGEEYYGEGATLFGKGGHSVRLRRSGNGFVLHAQDAEGRSFTTTLMRE